MAHENLTREEHIQGSSDRTFGFVFATLFIIIACWPLFFDGAIRWWSIAIAAMFTLAALIKPTLLSRMNRLWMKFGILLGKVVSPIALGILFYLVITPTGVMMRLTGKDPLRLKFDPAADSYWIPREPPGPQPGSMNNQF